MGMARKKKEISNSKNDLIVALILRDNPSINTGWILVDIDLLQVGFTSFLESGANFLGREKNTK